MRLRRLIASLLLSPLLASFATAADTKSAPWLPTRTTAPDSIAELKTLQETVKGLVAKVTPATVAVILGEVDPSRSGPQSVGAGSGVIVSDDGLVLTAAHVIEPPSFGFGGLAPRRERELTTVRLLLPGNIEVSGKILGRNPGLDSGMVKITDPVPSDATWPGAKEGKWPFVEIGDSAKLGKGQWVVALGHPGGPKRDRRAPVRLGQMVEVGEKAKSIVSDCTLVGGDSGGPLFDLTGKLVGIHSRIGDKIDDNVHVSTKAFQDEWKRLVRGDIIGRGEPRAILGVTLNRDGKMEPIVEQLSENSPSSKAGIKVGDRLLKLNGNAIEKTTDVDEIMSQMRPGDIVTVEIRRGDEILEAKVTLGRRNNRPQP